MHGFNPGIPQSSIPMTNPVIVRDPITGNPILVSKEMGASFGKPSGRVGRDFEVDSQANPTTPARSPNPSLTGGLGGRGGHGGDRGGNPGGGDDGDGGGGTPPTPPFITGFTPPASNQGRKPRRSQAPGGGGGDPDGGGSDDSDDRFAKRLKKFLRSRDDEDKHDDKPKVKEADSIKIPAFPTPESYYRNWRIKTREAVVAASTKPDDAFNMGERSVEGRTVDRGPAEGGAVCYLRCKAYVSPHKRDHGTFC